MSKDPYKYFRIEARELVEELSQGFIDLEQGRFSQELIKKLFRLAHTLKGAARVVNERVIADAAHALEDVLDPFREGAEPPSKPRIAELFGQVDVISQRLDQLPSSTAATSKQTAEPSPAPSISETEQPFSSVRVEIQELDALLYELTEAAVHLAALQEDLAALGRLSQSVWDYLQNAESGQVGRTPKDVLLSQNQVRQILQRWRAGSVSVQRDLESARRRAGELRLLPANVIFGMLNRAVRDAADSLGKKVRFETLGGELKLDAHVLLPLRDALLHVVRNAVAHGVETSSRRRQVGKPEAGKVSICVERKGDRIQLAVEDDGAGIDLEAVRRAALRFQLMDVADLENLSAEQLTQLLYRSGVTTASDLSHVSGRGVGLDVVRTTVERLNGSVAIETKTGKGTKVSFNVPFSIESMKVLEVAAGNKAILIPFNTIHRAIRVHDSDLIQTSAGRSLIWEGKTISFRPLADVLQYAAAIRNPSDTQTALILRSGAGVAAVGVDGLRDLKEVVLRPLPAACGSVPLIAGATLDAQGNPELVADSAALIAAVEAGDGAPNPAPPRPAPRILVVDDSLTSRMLEQTILESAGFQVELAVDAEQALRITRDQRFDLFIVDVEMPGMNGFELVERFRSDPTTHSTPAILVTSLSSPEHRKRGRQAGARAYITKGEFNEGNLLKTIREILSGDFA